MDKSDEKDATTENIFTFIFYIRLLAVFTPI